MPKILRTLTARQWFWTARRVGGVLLRSPFDSAQRWELRRLADAMRFTEGKPRLPGRPLEDALRVLGDATPTFRMVLPTPGKWGVTTYELAVINAIAAVLRPKAVFEFGTFTGRTTLNLRNNAPPDAVVSTIDLPPERQRLPDGLRAGQLIDEQNIQHEGGIERLHGDSLAYDFATYHGTQELVFIDAGHTYECASRDTAVALEMTAGRRAVILWHDYRGISGVSRAVDELLTDPPANDFFAMLDGSTLACLIRRGE